jgi:hypothetical protein
MLESKRFSTVNPRAHVHSLVRPLIALLAVVRAFTADLRLTCNRLHIRVTIAVLVILVFVYVVIIAISRD